jgi:hypothetical protein
MDQGSPGQATNSIVPDRPAKLNVLANTLATKAIDLKTSSGNIPQLTNAILYINN